MSYREMGSSDEKPEDGSAHDRYPGTRSFHDDTVDACLFKGRSEEIRILTHRVRAVRLLLLFGKSGLGKTSLLQAGLFPALREQHTMLPVSIRFNRTQPPLEPGELVGLVIQGVLKVARQRGIDPVPSKGGQRGSLWEFFKTTDFWQGEQLLRPVLVFDQFEEVFTLQGPKFRQALAEQLKALAGRGLPEGLRRRRDAGNRPQYDSTPPDIHLILSFREEYLAELEALVADLPGLLEHRFRLAPLNRGHAEDAIVGPAEVEDGEMFRAGRFSYQPGTLKNILDFLSNEAGEVEPFQLQVICSHIERQVVAAQGKLDSGTQIEVDEAILGGRKAMNAVLSRFYEDSLRRIGRYGQRRRARRLCEEDLVSSGGNRISSEESGIWNRHKVNPETLTKLIDARLLRKDTRPGLKGYYYELSHDSLVAPVLKGLKRSRQRRVAGIAAAGSVLLLPAFLSWWDSQETIAQVKNELKQSTGSVIALCAQLARNPPNAKPLERRGDGPEMMVVEAGTACVGDINGLGLYRERPVRVLEIAQPFALGRYEVTFEEYDAFARVTQRNLPSDENWGRGRRPVINVSWEEARAYADWLSGQTGTRYRLPTEAEWEYAARAGTITSRFWGDDESKACQYGNVYDQANKAALKEKYGFDEDTHRCEDPYAGTSPVDANEFQPNPLGLSQMQGNVWEWTEDCWHGNYEGAPGDGSVWLGGNGGECTLRVVRGGSWYDTPGDVRSAFRHRYKRDTRLRILGFRLAQDLD